MRGYTEQCSRILDYMEAHGSITDAEAHNISVGKLSSRISDMVKAGIPIRKEWEYNLNKYGEKVRYKRYFLDKEVS